MFQTAGVGVVETVLNRWGACLVSINHPWHEVTRFYTGPWKGGLERGQSGWVKTFSGGREHIHIYGIPTMCQELYTSFPCNFSVIFWGKERDYPHFTDYEMKAERG